MVMPSCPRVLGVSSQSRNNGRLSRVRDETSMSDTPKTIYTLTDEASFPAVWSQLSIIEAIADAEGVAVETRDVSLAGRIASPFRDDLAEPFVNFGASRVRVTSDVGRRVSDGCCVRCCFCNPRPQSARTRQHGFVPLWFRAETVAMRRWRPDDA